MNKFLILVGVVLPFVLGGCGTYEHTVQIDDKAYLLLIGSPEGNVVVIDGGEPIDLSSDTASFNLNGKKITKIQLSIGSHTIKVMKNGVLTIHRKFYVSTGTSFEVKL